MTAVGVDQTLAGTLHAKSRHADPVAANLEHVVVLARIVAVQRPAAVLTVEQGPGPRAAPVATHRDACGDDEVVDGKVLVKVVIAAQVGRGGSSGPAEDEGVVAELDGD